MDPNQAACLSYPTTLLQMLPDRQGLLLGELATVQRRTLAFREAFLTGSTGQDPAFFVGAVAEANPQVIPAALTVVRAAWVLAAEGFQVVHDVSNRSQVGEKVDSSCN
jgi:hypothetical protein